MQTRPYTDKNGNNNIWTEVVAERVDFTGEKSANVGENAASKPSPKPPQGYGTTQSNPPVDDNPYPF